ncbi:hypothetical protein LBMAG16_13210 [Actinomycetes bacterium]|nr:hypothetical protein LBMAG16_13210 [Actinomycetes bacterium]
MLTNESHAFRLASAHLRTLISAQIVDLESDLEIVEFGSAVGAVVNGIAWALLIDRHDRGLGPAMIWALRSGAAELKIFTQFNAGDLARRARFFNFKIEIFEITKDIATSAVLAAPSDIEALEVSPADELFAEFIKSSGADLTREHGVLAGEVCGLEVCRVVHDVSDNGIDESILEIGTGTHDREMFKMLHGRTATLESLRKVVVDVSSKRVAGLIPHPLNQLGRERLLRHLLCASPDLVDAVSLQSAAPAMPRANLKDSVPCCAQGILKNGAAVVAIFSIGVDPDVVAFGADARQQIDPSADLVFVSPPRDIVPAIVRLAETLHNPARFYGCNLLDASTQRQQD